MPALLLAALAAAATVGGSSSSAGIRLEPHGPDGIVVTVTPQGAATPPLHYPSALLQPAPPPDEARLLRTPTSLTHGNLRVRLMNGDVDGGGVLVFERVSDGAELLREVAPRSFSPVPGTGSSGYYYSADLTLAAYDNERIYGLGQHQTGALDNLTTRGSPFRSLP
jgi:alpha-D-xyloside xylohydrolase